MSEITKEQIAGVRTLLLDYPPEHHWWRVGEVVHFERRFWPNKAELYKISPDGTIERATSAP